VLVPEPIPDLLKAVNEASGRAFASLLFDVLHPYLRVVTCQS
jgi:hypothetical protein